MQVSKLLVVVSELLKNMANIALQRLGQEITCLTHWFPFSRAYRINAVNLTNIDRYSWQIEWNIGRIDIV
ncbi:uncharacterized protein PHALS_13314 [Plasmopara halstedii]|uniref:Uncharacterized protein n=1 Tax=Plasmopara halstedii TaxID=4781 RepID=A0A0P1AQH2_PLAHL|nr:uncharacterized protein PHALS_13314 [Plasmopara halstedii]CEG43096.1 hypothetical protein PHALS_13314 [Plasmopara halstedii]|eukprot:XP_024579465.1 hypothetical protein PHALS_13314 [Plasmopara halstedii]